jgi:hypothetical protein
MTITNDYSLFQPEVADLFDESFERAGFRPKEIGTDHIQSITRSLKFLFSEWHTVGMRQWMIVRGEQTLTQGDVDFDLPAGAVDIMSAVLSRSGRVTPMYRASRTDYFELVDKTIQGRPDRYFVDRRFDRCTVFIWQAPENSTDILQFDYFRQMANPGALANTLQMPPHALDACAHGLAARIAQKFNPNAYLTLQVEYRGPDPNKIGGKLKMAIEEDRDRADVVFSFQRRPAYRR